MSEFVCYMLEGLVRQNGAEMWMTLGTFHRLEELEAARAAPRRADVVETRVSNYYRARAQDIEAEAANAIRRTSERRHPRWIAPASVA